jgi:hypothetical protein
MKRRCIGRPEDSIEMATFSKRWRSIQASKQSASNRIDVRHIEQSN